MPFLFDSNIDASLNLDAHPLLKEDVLVTTAKRTEVFVSPRLHQTTDWGACPFPVSELVDEKLNVKVALNPSDFGKVSAFLVHALGLKKQEKQEKSKVEEPKSPA